MNLALFIFRYGYVENLDLDCMRLDNVSGRGRLLHLSPTPDPRLFFSNLCDITGIKGETLGAPIGPVRIPYSHFTRILSSTPTVSTF